MHRTFIRTAVAMAAPVLILASTGLLWTVHHPSTEQVGFRASTIPVAARIGLSGPDRLSHRQIAEARTPDGLLVSGTLPTIRENIVVERPSAPRTAAPPSLPHPAAPAPRRVHTTPSPSAPPASVGGAAGEQFALVNQDRAANGVAPLAYSAMLARVAQYRAQEMLTRNYFSHYNPDTGQLAFVELLQAWGITYMRAGENIAWSTNPSMAGINTLFMNSPDHRANILNPAFHHVGIGVATDGQKTMVAEVFTN